MHGQGVQTAEAESGFPFLRSWPITLRNEVHPHEAYCSVVPDRVCIVRSYRPDLGGSESRRGPVQRRRRQRRQDEQRWVSADGAVIGYVDNPDTSHPPDQNAVYNWNSSLGAYVDEEGYRVYFTPIGGGAGYLWEKRDAGGNLVDVGTMY